MTTTLSTKGQVVLPQAARRRLGLKPGVRLDCRVAGHEIVLTPQGGIRARPRSVRDRATGMIVTQAPKGLPAVTDEQVRTLLADFP
jgi:AbrB family looped-hinge helix DNA binding protein